jgi:hypothetical protein
LRQKYWRTQNALIKTENIHKYLQQQNQAKLIAKTGKTYCENNWVELTTKSLNIGACLK